MTVSLLAAPPTESTEASATESADSGDDDDTVAAIAGGVAAGFFALSVALGIALYVFLQRRSKPSRYDKALEGDSALDSVVLHKFNASSPPDSPERGPIDGSMWNR